MATSASELLFLHSFRNRTSTLGQRRLRRPGHRRWEPHTSDWQSWVALAAADAAENRVTPLRRFLWRYGRDLVNPRRHYKMLVELFELSTNSDEMSNGAASIVFEALPEASEGAVLKRDIIGIGSHSPRLVSAISAVHLLELLTSEALPVMITPSEVRQRLEELSAPQIGKVARYYDDHREELAPWNEFSHGSDYQSR